MPKLGPVLIALLVSVALPATLHAEPQKKGSGGGGKPAPAARPAPQVSAPRPQPHFSAPRPQPHISVQRSTPRIQSTPRFERRIEHAAPRHERPSPHLLTVPSSPQFSSRPNVLRVSPTLQQAPRRNGQPRLALQAAQQGRFAAAFAHHRQFANIAPRTAWRRGHRAGFVAWYGPVFWPYAYADIFDYSFWPYAYDDGYWAYMYDDVFDGVFWGEAGPPPEYVEGAEYPRQPNASYASVRQLCDQPGAGVTAWPFAELQKGLRLTEAQRSLLGDVRAAAADAQSAFKQSCPSQQAFSLTPPGRLRMMTARLDAVLQAVATVRPPLTRFYDSLSDEQKERFNEIGPEKRPQNEEARAAQDTQSCKQPKPGLANLPIEQIEDAVKPDAAQEESLNRLQDATVKAVAILQDACPDQVPLTPPGRLAMMEARLNAMIAAAHTVGPALDDFYASLSNEQKARFNRMGRNLARSE